MGYYGICQTPYILKELDSWVRRRIRSFIWKKWETYQNRVRELKQGGVKEWPAIKAASLRGLWKVSNSKAIRIALPNKYFETMGILSLKSLVKV